MKVLVAFVVMLVCLVLTTEAHHCTTPGESIPAGDGCNTCMCNHDGTIGGCTLMNCDSGKYCEYKGQLYPSGTSFMDDCNTCSCEDGFTMCTEMACAPCIHQGETIPSGETFMDDCNTCRCFNGVAGCTLMACPKEAHHCTTPGESIAAGDGCNTCMCNHDGTIGGCTLMNCDSGKYCEYKGQLYPSGTTFMDDCNTCSCEDGLAICTQMACSPCIHQGETIPSGETFMDDCNTCRCFNGVAGCTLMACPKDSDWSVTED